MYNGYVAIGKPIKGLKMRIVNDDGTLAENGAEGSLELKGELVLSSYMNETDDEHDRHFTDDGWFRTGDLAVFENGEYIITGRQAQIFIFNGNNISIGSIENYLVDEISEAGFRSEIKGINIRNEQNGVDELFVFAEKTHDDSELGNLIFRKLTERYGFRPNVILIPENEFPHSALGKINVKELIENTKKGVYKLFNASDADDSIATNETFSDEVHLIKLIWSEALNIPKEKIGLNDDFFNLGGTSLDVPDVLNKINISFGKDINASEFVRYATIHKLLELFDQNNSEEQFEEEIIIL